MPLQPRGYAWWYIDGLSNDGRHAITVKAFVGSVFSPFYFNSRDRLANLYPETATTLSLALGSQAQHWWQPLLPRARIEVLMQKPPLRWAGTGYLDTHYGMSPLDEGMRGWSWLRAHRTNGTTVIFDVAATGESPHVHALSISHFRQGASLRDTRPSGPAQNILADSPGDPC
jgi:hypothetical protein